jgi:GNAT superfamily N-acetyltransferase
VKAKTDAFLIGDFEIKKLYLLSRIHGTGLGRALISEATVEAGRLAARQLVGSYLESMKRTLQRYAFKRESAFGRR